MQCVINCWNNHPQPVYMATQNINDIFFKGLYKDVWRKLIPPGLSEAECDFIEQEMNIQPDARLLDLMCGYGRHALPLARKGFRVSAIDNAPEYIEEINAKGEGLAIETQVAGLMDMHLEGQYDAAICMGNSFCFFTRKEAVHILHHLHRHLKQGAHLMINTWMLGEIAIRHFKEKDWFYVEDYKYLVDSRYLFQPARVEAEHIIIKETGETEVLQSVDYIFTLSEMEALLKETGFELITVYSIPKKRTFKLGDSKAYIIAQRQD
jgi:SAM-dependent methyltransferase